jgi:acyl-CoA synthetase (AMP-forming)/AMP-acid ligase II
MFGTAMLERVKQFIRAGKALALANPGSNKTIAHQFERHAHGAAADRPFLLYGNERYTYREANVEVNRHANAYRGLGVGKGDVVALMLDNRPSLLWHYLALGKLGAVASLINTNNTGEPLLHSLRVCNPRLMVIGSEHLIAFDPIRAQLDDKIGVFVDVDPERPTTPSLPTWSGPLAAASTEDPPETSQHKLEDLAAYIYTSGTTGLPKAALVRHLRLYGLGELLGAVGWGLRPDDVIYNCLPLYHTNGIGVCTGSVIAHGATMALARKFSAKRFWDDIRRHDATGFIYIGELCRYLMNQPERDDDRDHKVRAICGNGLRADIWPGFKQRFGIERVAEFYGSTEGNIGSLNLDDTVGSVGRLLFGGALARWDEDKDDFVRGPDGFMVKCKPGEPGVLLGRINKRQRFDGYHDESATSKKVVRDAFKRGDAWFNTGDLLRIDKSRRLFFVDRMGDTFRWKGENVSTFEVQEQVSSWPTAAEVNAYGVQIPGTEGRAGMVAMVLKSASEFDGESFRRHVDSSLPPYARPLFVRVRETLETTGTFKLKKGELTSEGFDPLRVADPIFFRDPARNAYVPLTTEVYEQLKTGKLRL